MTAADRIAVDLKQHEKNALKLLDIVQEYDGLPGFHGVATALRELAHECRLHVQGMHDQLNALRAAIQPHLGEGPNESSRH